MSRITRRLIAIAAVAVLTIGLGGQAKAQGFVAPHPGGGSPGPYRPHNPGPYRPHNPGPYWPHHPAGHYPPYYPGHWQPHYPPHYPGGHNPHHPGGHNYPTRPDSNRRY
jgi:hypothetical protein